MNPLTSNALASRIAPLYVPASKSCFPSATFGISLLEWLSQDITTMTNPVHSIPDATLREGGLVTPNGDRMTLLETGTVFVATFLMFWIAARFFVLRLNFPIWGP